MLTICLEAFSEVRIPLLLEELKSRFVNHMFLDAHDDVGASTGKQTGWLWLLLSRCPGVCQLFRGHTLLCNPGFHFRRDTIFHVWLVGRFPQSCFVSVSLLFAGHAPLADSSLSTCLSMSRFCPCKDFSAHLGCYAATLIPRSGLLHSSSQT